MGQAAADGVLGNPLQMQIQRCVHIDGLVRRGREAGVVLVDRLRHVVDEVRRFSFERALNNNEWFPGCGDAFFRRDEIGVDHRLDDNVASLSAPVRVVERRQ